MNIVNSIQIKDIPLVLRDDSMKDMEHIDFISLLIKFCLRSYDDLPLINQTIKYLRWKIYKEHHTLNQICYVITQYNRSIYDFPPLLDLMLDNSQILDILLRSGNERALQDILKIQKYLDGVKLFFGFNNGEWKCVYDILGLYVDIKEDIENIFVEISRFFSVKQGMFLMCFQKCDLKIKYKDITLYEHFLNAVINGDKFGHLDFFSNGKGDSTEEILNAMWEHIGENIPGGVYLLWRLDQELYRAKISNETDNEDFCNKLTIFGFLLYFYVKKEPNFEVRLKQKYMWNFKGVYLGGTPEGDDSKALLHVKWAYDKRGCIY